MGKLTPTIAQYSVSSLRADGRGVLDELPWQLREGFAVYRVSTLLCPEEVLLAIACVPHPVHKEIYHR